MKTFTLPAKLGFAIGAYYLGRAKQTDALILTNRLDGSGSIEWKRHPWDKEQALKNISDALPKGWDYQASAGTFWITIPNKSYKGGRVCYEVDDTTWPHGNKFVAKKK